MRFEAARIHFLSDVFVAVAVVVAYALVIIEMTRGGPKYQFTI